MKNLDIPPKLEKLWIRRVLEQTDDAPEWQRYIDEPLAGLEPVLHLEDTWPQPLDSESEEFFLWDEHLKLCGWQWLDTSVRQVYYKYNAVLKIAVDGSGLIQNCMEAMAYGDNVGNLDMSAGKDGVSVLRIPRLVSCHPKHYWLMQEMAPEGITPDNVPAEFVQLLKEWQFEDLRTDNFRLTVEPGREEYWFYDLGCYCWDPIERQSLIWRY